MSFKILLVEDEDAIADPLSFLLEAESYEVYVAKNGREALEKFDVAQPDLVLLDLMLPEISGLEVCAQLRLRSQVPIIMLTAKDTELDIVVGLERGADDYVTKPYSTGELLARIRALLRRSLHSNSTQLSPQPESTKPEHSLKHVEMIEALGVTLDPQRYELFVRGNAINMPLREFELLRYLMQEAGRVLTRDQLLNRVWGSDYYGDTKTLDVHIKRIRDRIEPDPKEPSLLKTVRGVGYRFG